MHDQCLLQNTPETLHKEDDLQQQQGGLKKYSLKNVVTINVESVEVFPKTNMELENTAC